MTSQLEARPGGVWKNLWRELYEEEWGKEETEKRIQDQFKFPAAGIGSGLGLFIQTSKLVFAFGISAKRNKKRPSHAYGVGAMGFAKVVEDPSLPDNEFFTPGRSFRVRIRHGNFRYHDDDAMLDGRSVSIKFDDVTDGGPLDLIMNTGHINFFQNLSTFIPMARMARETNEEVLKQQVYDRPINLESIISYVRRAPSSFTHVNYYSLLTYLLRDKTGNQHHVRFRCVPADVIGKEESGLPNVEEQRKPWQYERLPEEKRSKTYLRDGYRSLVSEREVLYHVQVQVHGQYSVDSDPELFNSSTAWDPEQYPWRPLVDVTITTPMSDDETEKTLFNIAARPSCLSYPSPISQYDYNSIPYAREKVYRQTQAKRS